jgi:hypothetical protein
MRLLNTNHKALYIVNKLFSSACLDPATAGEPWVGALHKALVAVVGGGARLPVAVYFSDKGMRHITLGSIPPSRRIIFHWAPLNASMAWAFFSLGPDGRMQWRPHGGAKREGQFTEKDMKAGHALVPSLRAHLQLVTDSIRSMPERI